MTRHMFTLTDICHIIGMGGRGEGITMTLFLSYKNADPIFSFSKMLSMASGKGNVAMQKKRYKLPC